MVVHVGFPPMLLVEVPVGDVDVVQGWVVVIVRVGGQQVPPVLAPVQVVRHVIVLVPVLRGFVLVMTLWLRHRAHLFRVASPSRDRPYISRCAPTNGPSQRALARIDLTGRRLEPARPRSGWGCGAPLRRCCREGR